MRYWLIYTMILVAGFACRDPYNPTIKNVNTKYLVVEGDIINASGPTVFRLSRTAPMVDSAAIMPELNATVTVEGDDNASSWYAQEQPGGSYNAGVLNLDVNRKYRVHIVTTNGKEYVSEFAAVRNNPPIDTVHWRWDKESGVKLFVDTHDPAGNARYYRWAFDETWEHVTYYYSTLKYLPATNRIVDRPLEEYTPKRCWQYDYSRAIIVGSTAKLSADVIKDKQLTTIPNQSWKLGVKYSILVRQYTMDKSALDYWQMMQRNTEQIGTIFSPQPSESRGNISCLSDLGELVIGWVGVTSVREKRIFISRSELPNWNYSMGCEEFLIVNDPDSIRDAFGAMGLEPLQIDMASGRIQAVRPACENCALQAIPVKPSYWPQ